MSAGETQDLLETKTLFFSFLTLKGTKAQVLCSQPLTLGPSEEKANCGCAESLEREAQEGDVGSGCGVLCAGM